MTWDTDADSTFNWYNKVTADNLVAAQSWTRYNPLIATPGLTTSRTMCTTAISATACRSPRHSA